MTENIETINSKNDDLQKNEYIDSKNHDSKPKNVPTKNVIFIVTTIIILLLSFFISAIIASKNYEAIFTYLKEKIF